MPTQRGGQDKSTFMKEKLLLLYELQQLDSALDAIKRQYAALDRGQTEKAHYDAVKAAFEEAAAALKAVETDLNDTTLEQKGVETKRKTVETKLYSGSVSNPKELQAMTDEVEMLARRRERLDEKIATLLGDLEACRSREAEAKAAKNAAARAYNVKATAANEQKSVFTNQAEALIAQRSASAVGIPPDLLKRYDALRAAKHGLAIVVLEDGNACGGCKMGLSRDMVARVRLEGAVVMCENCGRMLCDKR